MKANRRAIGQARQRHRAGLDVVRIKHRQHALRAARVLGHADHIAVGLGGRATARYQHMLLYLPARPEGIAVRLAAVGVDQVDAIEYQFASAGAQHQQLAVARRHHVRHHARELADAEQPRLARLAGRVVQRDLHRAAGV
ncbi:conserved hypothetical protein, partial [Ricinus communis]